MNKLMTLKKEILIILILHPETRGSDEKLYKYYLARHGISTISIEMFLNYFNEYDVSDFESVTRCRRKIMEEHPDLRPPEKIRGFRKEREQEFKEFAKEKEQ